MGFGAAAKAAATEDAGARRGVALRGGHGADVGAGRRETRGCGGARRRWAGRGGGTAGRKLDADFMSSPRGLFDWCGGVDADDTRAAREERRVGVRARRRPSARLSTLDSFGVDDARADEKYCANVRGHGGGDASLVARDVEAGFERDGESVLSLARVDRRRVSCICRARPFETHALDARRDASPFVASLGGDGDRQFRRRP